MAEAIRAGYRITVKGPLLVKGDKNLLKGVRKGLVKVAKSVTEEVQKRTPSKTGTLRRNIGAGKPHVTRAEAFVTITPGSSHGGATNVKTNAIGDVVYALWGETGQRRGATMNTRKGGYKMFEKSEKIVKKPKILNDFGKKIAKELGG